MSALEKWKMIYGTTLLAALVALAVMIALGKVMEDSSFGLREIVMALALLSQNFSSWAFGGRDKANPQAGDK